MRCHRLELSSWDDGQRPNQGVRTAFRRTAYHSTRPRDLSPLAVKATIGDSGIGTLTSELRSHERREQLALVIPFLTGSERSEFLEDRIVRVFTALEALVCALGKAPDPDALTVRGVRKELGIRLAEIESVSPERERAVERLRSGLGDLGQLHIAARVARFVELHGVKWDDLWPASGSLENHLRGSFKLRNAVIHQAQLSDPHRSDPEATRIYLLTERLLYAVLKGDPAWIYRRAWDGAMVRKYLWTPDERATYDAQ